MINIIEYRIYENPMYTHTHIPTADKLESHMNEWMNEKKMVVVGVNSSSLNKSTKQRNQKPGLCPWETKPE